MQTSFMKVMLVENADPERVRAETLLYFALILPMKPQHD